MEFLLPLLGGALGAALVNGILALYKIKRDRLTEHDQWLRNEKIATYSQYTESIRKADMDIRHVIGGATSVEDAWKTGDNFPGHKLYLIAPKAIQDAAEFHRTRRIAVLDLWKAGKYKKLESEEYKTALRALDKAREDLIEVMAKDLGIVDRQKVS